MAVDVAEAVSVDDTEELGLEVPTSVEDVDSIEPAVLALDVVIGIVVVNGSVKLVESVLAVVGVKLEVDIIADEEVEVISCMELLVTSELEMGVVDGSNVDVITVVEDSGGGDDGEGELVLAEVLEVSDFLLLPLLLPVLISFAPLRAEMLGFFMTYHLGLDIRSFYSLCRSHFCFHSDVHMICVPFSLPGAAGACNQSWIAMSCLPRPPGHLPFSLLHLSCLAGYPRLKWRRDVLCD